MLDLETLIARKKANARRHAQLRARREILTRMNLCIVPGCNREVTRGVRCFACAKKHAAEQRKRDAKKKRRVQR